MNNHNVHPEEQAIHREFLSHSAWLAQAAVLLIGIALGIGICGYHFLEGLPWIDSLLNASMILGGMGPVDTLRTTAGKLFASFYALFAGLVFIALVGFVVSPLIRATLRRVHHEERLRDKTSTNG